MTAGSMETGPDGRDASGPRKASRSSGAEPFGDTVAGSAEDAAAPGMPATSDSTAASDITASDITTSDTVIVGEAVAIGVASRASDPPRGRLAAGARRHWLFGVLLAAGAALRALAMYAYRPAFEFSGDSYAYLTLSHLSRPDPMRPAGYPLLLRLLGGTHRLAVVPAVQHAAGLGTAVALYALLVRRRLHPALAALATAPVLLDAYQVDIEHFVMAETLFGVLLVGALAALLWSARPSAAACALAGGLLAAAAMVRTLGAVLGVLSLVYLLARRLSWPRLGAFTLLLAAPLAAYATWFHGSYGSYALTGGDGAWLYGRVAPIADCSRLHLTTEQRRLCSPHAPADRPGPNYYVWADTSPRFQLTGSDRHKNAVMAGFAHQVILRQPLDYARMVAADVGHYFVPGRNTGYRDWPVGSWQFPTSDPPYYWHISVPLLDFDGGHPERVVGEPQAGWLRAYQRYCYTPGPLLAVLVVLALVAGGLGLPRVRLPELGLREGRLRRPKALEPPRTPKPDKVNLVTAPRAGPRPGSRPGPDGNPGAGPGRRRPSSGLAALGLDDPAGGRRDTATPARSGRPLSARAERRAEREARRARQDPVVAERRRLGADCALLAAMAAAVLVVPSATVCFDYRYLLPVLVLLPPAAALAIRQYALSRRADPSRPHGSG